MKDIIDCQLGYLVKPKQKLFSNLLEKGSDIGEYFTLNYVVTTDILDYEEYFEGWKLKIVELAKEHFIKDTVFELEYSQEEFFKLFGTFEKLINLFDRWWVLEEVDISQIKTTWK